MLPQGAQGEQGQGQQQGAPGPFVLRPQGPQVVLTSGGQPVLPLAGSGGSGLPPLSGSGGSGIPFPGSGGSGTPLPGSGGSIDAAILQQYYAGLGGGMFNGMQLGGSGGSGIPLVGSGGSGLPLAGAFSLPEQQFAIAGAWPDSSGAAFASSMSLPILPGYAAGQASMQQGTTAAAAKGPKSRKARPYKPPDQVQAEKKKKAEVQAYCRQLEQQLGRAKTELEKLQQENKALQTKAVVLNRHTSFRRSAAAIAEGITPIAAASLGQVYKGVLRSTGEAVAVKVQRPGVLETVTVDLYIIRTIGLFLRRFPSITRRADVVSLLDEWAARFFEELDYVREGNNATIFAEQIKDDLPQVVVPRTYAEYTSRRVLTTQWLEGEKLSQSQADDVGRLVNVGVICYLKQLLDTGFFHADPHPGNLIRTPDGRLAILDFGLMTTVDDDIKYGMIEAISHLIHRDYEAIVEDFVTLQFIPPGTDLKPILPALANVFDQALAGGGAKNINFNDLAADLAEITFTQPFRIPPYFALIIRAIGVLEGIALVGNPEFAIVDEAFPYIAKRLMTDSSPRLQEALRYMVYGRDTVFDADRLIDLLDAFETFTVASRSARGDMDLTEDPLQQAAQQRLAAAAVGRTSTVPDNSSGPASTSGRALGFPGAGGFPSSSGSDPFGQLAGALTGLAMAPLSALGGPAGGGPGVGLLSTQSVDLEDSRTREALRFLLSPEGVWIREFLLEELVKSIDALSRDQLRALLVRLGLQNLAVPVVIPGANRLFLQVAPPLSDEDRRVVDNVSKLVNFLSGGSAARALSGRLDPRALQELAPLLPGVATQVLPELSRRLAGRITARLIRELFV